jgi:hypothetical protein
LLKLRRLLPLHCLALVATIACAVVGSARATLSAQVRDSAGIRIVSNPSRLSAPITLRIGDRPLLSVGGLHDDPEQEFESNQGYLRGVLLSDGGLVAIDVNRVKYFDATGKLVKIAGRRGDGPGEFRYLTAICRLRGDTIVVSDRSRLGVLDGRGNFVRHLPSAPRYLPFEGCFGDNAVLLQTMHNGTPAPGRAEFEMWRTPISGGSPIALGRVEGSAFSMTAPEVIIAVQGDRVIVADPTFNRLAVYNASGAGPVRLSTLIRTADVNAKITDAEHEAQLAMTIPNNVSADERRQRMERMRTIPRAESWPAFGRVYVEPTGNLWLADYQRNYPGSVGYTRFDREGRMTGRLVLAPGTGPGLEARTEVIGFAADRILVRRWDSDGATYLRVYPIVPVR